VLHAEFFEQDPVTCARALIGTTFCWDGAGGIVVETEAYAEFGDEACHTFSRPSARRFIEHHPAGSAYVYLNYGVHWLTNVLIKNGQANGFVLFRALAPTQGLPAMRTRRGKEHAADLCSGPGKLSQALGIHGIHHGESLVASPERAFLPAPADAPVLVLATGPRIGISKSAHLLWRFGWAGSPHLSTPFPKAGNLSSDLRRDE
jgi:DNA-3-methyladenine glycosylase